MRILIIDPNHAERTQAEKILVAERHEVRTAPDGESGFAYLDSFDPDLVIIDHQLPRFGAGAGVKRIRAADQASHRYVIVTAGTPVRGDLATAFAAGADDFIRKPLQRDELIARVDGPVRVRSWAGRMRGDGSACELTQLLAWREGPAMITQDLTTLLGMPFTFSTGRGVAHDDELVAMLPLCLPDVDRDIGVYIAIDERSAHTLGEIMFGQPCTAVELRDLVGETANVAAGALKRALSAEGKSVTTGLPRRVAATSATSAPLGRIEFALTSEAGVQLKVVLRLNEHEPCMIAAGELREGMVLRVDVRTAGGGLLLKCGTRLTEAHLPRLIDAVGGKRLIEVADAA